MLRYGNFLTRLQYGHCTINFYMLDSAWKDKSFQKALTVVSLTIALLVVFLGIYWRSLPPEIPIFYGRPWGQSMLGKPFFLFLPTGVALVFFIVNFFLLKFFPGQSFVRNVLIWGGASVVVLAVITSIRIILLVV